MHPLSLLSQFIVPQEKTKPVLVLYHVIQPIQGQLNDITLQQAINLRREFSAKIAIPIPTSKYSIPSKKSEIHPSLH